MTTFEKQPLEFYGNLVTTTSHDDLAAAFDEQQCPFLHKRCVKQRKSESSQTIGTCIVGYGGQPLIICPHRFLQRQQIFLDSISLLAPRMHYFIIPELTMPGGSIDYCLVAARGDEIVEYLGLEIQSLDTTGSGGLWMARENFVAGTHLAGMKYTYGINWKMSAKTILMQMHHKAASFAVLGKKLILVVQREFFEYVTKEFQTTHLRPADTNDAVHFHVYDVVLLQNSLSLVLVDRKSTDVAGVERMLNLGHRTELLEHEVLARIRARMSQAIPLKP